MTQTNRPTLAPARNDGVDAAKGPSILAALEQTSTRKPVLGADRPSASRRLPWHWPVMALGLAGAALWGYASWSSRAPSADARTVVSTPMVAPTNTPTPTSTLPVTSRALATPAIASTIGNRAAPDNERARGDTKAADGGIAVTPATLVEVPATAVRETAAKGAVAAAARELAAKGAVASSREPSSTQAMAAPAAMPPVTKKATPKSANATTRPATVRPATVRSATARPAAVRSALDAQLADSTAPEDDPDVAVVSALIGTARERNAAAAARERSVQAAAPAAAHRSTIAGLIRQCRELKPREASACRQRICDGYWGKAQACPAATVARNTAQR